MSNPKPLPFQIKVPGYDSIDSQGVVSISIKLEGFLHLGDDVVSFEWTATRKTEAVSLSGITDEVDHSPLGSCEIPLSMIMESHVRGGWWAPRLELLARTLEAFAEIPTAQNGRAILEIRRRDRKHARAICKAIEAARD